jgi:hypothetical protein
MKYIGVNIGALTVKLAALNGAETHSAVVPHQGRPVAVLKELLVETDFANADYVGVSGHLGHISEAAAIQRALREVKSEFDGGFARRRIVLVTWWPTAGSATFCHHQMRRRQR